MMCTGPSLWIDRAPFGGRLRTGFRGENAVRARRDGGDFVRRPALFAGASGAGRRGGAAHDQPGGHLGRRGDGLAGDAADQVLGRTRADQAGGHAHRGQARSDLGGERQVVEAGDGDVAGDVEPRATPPRRARRRPARPCRRRPRSAGPRAPSARACPRGLPPVRRRAPRRRADRARRPGGPARRARPPAARGPDRFSAVGPAIMPMRRWPIDQR